MQPGHDAHTYLSVSLDSGVYTSDLKLLGPISEIRGRFFRIKRPWWQRSYWLRTDYVRSSEPGKVVLNVDQDHLEDTKIVGDPPRD